METIGQLLAMRASPRNIIERTALWYRLERIGGELQQAEVSKQPLPEPEWRRGQWDYVRQIKAEVEGWRKKHAEMMLKLDRLLENKPF